ncbi:transcription factor bHLH160-like [Silene latifolia]|uniref:transcription factor bHLH160-like n=1 Tax=Silene latifolia TaxID=37657 RepID=UPI003D7819E9
MSNPPPFGNPIYSDDDFSFPIENQPFIIGDDEIRVVDDYVASSSLPNSEYQDLSMFLDDHVEEYPLIIGELNSHNIEIQETNYLNWVAQTSDDQQAQVRPHMQHDPMTTTTTTTTTEAVMIDEQQLPAALEVGQGLSCTKKLNHNAKERVRRMKLNDTFLALRALLPESRRAKKRWSAPYVIDRALEYIPELQKQIEKRTLEKDNMLSVIGNKQAISTEHDQHLLPHNNSTTLTVSINQVKDGQVIIQICEDKDKVGVLTTLFDKLEAEGVMVLGASSLCASQDRSCFHIHTQINKKPRESDYIENLHKKIISWLS